MLSELLFQGYNNAISSKDLQKMTGLTERELRKVVERERLDGELILANPDGYFLPSKDTEAAAYEIAAWCETQKTKALSMLYVERAVRKSAKEKYCTHEDKSKPKKKSK